MQLSSADPAMEVWLQELLAGPASRFLLGAGVTWDSWRGPLLTADEVHGLRRGVEGGLITIDLPTVTITGLFDKPSPYQLFMAYDGGTKRPGRAWTWSWRESLTQLAFAAELVIEHRWLAGEVALELAHLDVGVGSSARRHPDVAAEVKLRDTGPHSLDAMLAVFAELAGGPAATWVNKGDRDNAVPKYNELLQLRPPLFVAVAPGVRRVFEVEYTGGRITLAPASLEHCRRPSTGVREEGVR